jgi:hypothetical protein
MHKQNIEDDSQSKHTVHLKQPTEMFIVDDDELANHQSTSIKLENISIETGKRCYILKYFYSITV